MRKFLTIFIATVALMVGLGVTYALVKLRHPPGERLQAVEVSSGMLTTCAITPDGAAVCWGSGSSGLLGDGREINDRSSLAAARPVQVVGLESGVTSISVNSHACAVQHGAAKCWGANGFGQLGDGTMKESSTPVSVLGLDTGIKAVSVGYTHSCALTMSGIVGCWGGTPAGEGSHPGVGSLTPVAVAGLPDGIVAIQAGDRHTCALTNRGSVWCWGYNEVGQLGDGTTQDRDTPVQAIGLDEPITSISAAGFTTCGVDASGAAFCWGGNRSGQIGDGSTISRPTATPVFGLQSGVAAIAAGGTHACALTYERTVRCWGANGYGQFGNTSKSGSFIPMPSDFSSFVSAITAGAFSTCGIIDLSGDLDLFCSGLFIDEDGRDHFHLTPKVIRR